MRNAAILYPIQFPHCVVIAYKISISMNYLELHILCALGHHHDIVSNGFVYIWGYII